MIFLEIPLIPDTADQTLNITLAGVPYTLRVLYNVRFKYFSLSISEKNNGIILENIKMVHNFPLVKRFQRLIMPGDLFVLSRSGKDETLTFNSLQTMHALYYFDADDRVLPVPAPVVS